jgi:hypothetical protein
MIFRKRMTFLALLQKQIQPNMQGDDFTKRFH